MVEHEPETVDEAAVRYENDKDSDEWGEPVSRRRGKRLDAVVSVRFTPDELEIVRGAAGPRGLSQFVRNAALQAAVGLDRDHTAANSSAVAVEVVPTTTTDLIFFESSLPGASAPMTANIRVGHVAA